MILAFRSFTNRISLLFGWVAAALVLPLIFASVYEVGSRYLFNKPTIWAYEIGYMAMGACFLLAAAHTLVVGTHVRIDVLYMHMSRRTRAFFDLLGYAVLFLPLGVWLTYQLGLYALEAYHSGEHSGESAWNPVIWPFRTVFFLSFAALTLQAFAEALVSLQTLLTTPESTKND